MSVIASMGAWEDAFSISPDTARPADYAAGVVALFQAGLPAPSHAAVSRSGPSAGPGRPRPFRYTPSRPIIIPGATAAPVLTA